MSLVTYGKDLQREVNKRRSLLIAHATTNAGGVKVLFENGAVADPEEAEEDWNRPAAWVEVLDVEKIKPIPPVPLPTSLIQLEEFAKLDIEYVLGVPATSMGLNTETVRPHDTFSGLMALDEFAQRNMVPSMKNLYLGLKRLGKVIVDFIQHYMKAPQVIRIANPNLSGDLGMAEFSINMPMYDDTENAVMRVVNDVSVGRYDVEVVANSTSQRNKAVQTRQMLELFDRGIVDDIEVIKNVDVIDDRIALIQRKSMLVNMQNTIQQQTGELEKLTIELDKVYSQLKDEKLKVILINFKKHLNDVKLRALKEQLDINTQMKRAINEVRLSKNEQKQKSVASDSG